MNRTTKVFAGNEVLVNLIKGELGRKGINSLVKNDFNSGVLAGFVTDVPAAVELYVAAVNVKKATPIINGIVSTMK